jgi:hypothetical protein
MLARGAGIGSLEPLMETSFSRRALSRHRAKHMVHSVARAARPVPFPHSGSTLQRIRWLQIEVEHTAALAEQQGDLSTKLKALYELGRLLWLETRLTVGAIDVTPASAEVQYEHHTKQLEESCARREAELGPIPELSPEGEDRLRRAFERSTRSSQYQPASEAGTQDEASEEKGGV